MDSREDEKNQAAVEYYYAEIANLLTKANEPLRISMMLLSMAIALGHEVPEDVNLYLNGCKQLCDKMAFMCLPAGKAGPVQ